MAWNGGGAWQPAEPAAQPPLMLASTGKRVGAWLLDGFFIGLIAIPLFIVGFVTGAFSLNTSIFDRWDPYALNPYAGIADPLFTANATWLWILSGAWICLSYFYFAGSWVVWGATPAQRLLKLHVVNREGTHLAWPQATLRWLVLVGILTAISLVFMVLFFEELARIPAEDWGSSRFGTSANLGLSGLSWLVSIVSFGWEAILLATTANDPYKRGLHDRLAGSGVLTSEYPRLSPYGWGQAAYGQAGYPPAAYGPYPPAAYAPYPPYPPAAYPPYPGYPPAAYPPYPTHPYPGYPPAPYPPYPGYPPAPFPGGAYPPGAYPPPEPASPEPAAEPPSAEES